mmetsp:Transcript_893/g.3311  ORF Transcript_893/g.3311 Transcript_893/m.3311 type:complete len:335 (-) Transcript_893:2079-3083(-)
MRRFRRRSRRTKMSFGAKMRRSRERNQQCRRTSPFYVSRQLLLRRQLGGWTRRSRASRRRRLRRLLAKTPARRPRLSVFARSRLAKSRGRRSRLYQTEPLLRNCFRGQAKPARPGAARRRRRGGAAERASATLRRGVVGWPGPARKRACPGEKSRPRSNCQTGGARRPTARIPCPLKCAEACARLAPPKPETTKTSGRDRARDKSCAARRSRPRRDIKRKRAARRTFLSQRRRRRLKCGAASAGPATRPAPPAKACGRGSSARRRWRHRCGRQRRRGGFLKGPCPAASRCRPRRRRPSSFAGASPFSEVRRASAQASRRRDCGRRRRRSLNLTR